MFISSDDIAQYWELYTSKVSIPSMSISLETSRAIVEILEVEQPRTIVDLGSGFSTFLFYKYFESASFRPKNTSRISLDSFDTSSKWQEKTKRFIRENTNSHLLYSEFCLNPDPGEFASIYKYPVDFILLDIAATKYRLGIAEEILKYMHMNTILFIDDWHCLDYQPQMENILKKNHLDFEALYYTSDSFKRFGAIAKK